MRPSLLAALLLATLTTFAQNDFLVGYQEFPTSVMGQASDAQGNMYFTGIFKGQLKVNGQVLSSGSGQEDIFWVKTNASGQVTKHYTYGSSFSDATVMDGLAMGANNQMYFIAK